MTNLMLHCGAEIKSREEVFAVALPAETASYKPLAYESFVTRIEKHLAIEGIAIKQSQLALSKNGQRLFGLMELIMPGFIQKDYGLVLGLRTSYNKSFANGVCIGASVFVCDNLSFNGEVTFERKHTAGMLRDLTWMISETVTSLPMRYSRQSAAFENYKRRELEDKEVHDLAIRFWDAGALNSLDISRFIKEWRAPRHPEFVQAGRTAWRAFNSATEVIKGDLWNLPRRTQSIHRLLDDVCGLDGVSRPGPSRLPPLDPEAKQEEEELCIDV